jgi:hypothetical protein
MLGRQGSAASLLVVTPVVTGAVLCRVRIHKEAETV